KKILITGGSAGIGKALIHELLKHGAQDFAVIGRKKKPLEKLKKEIPSANFMLIQADVSNPKDLEKAVKQITESWEHLDILINSAGVVSAGLLSELS
ncbi:SDR family oxidoreductase, partial [Salegentibacter sp. JZCK2]|uniref:SDR family NAD(P)-dependent oxidoreductase n=1 Tax=Salegentibacter tibetensis TaxID=2873600 RepID=UPI001CCEBF5D